MRTEYYSDTHGGRVDMDLLTEQEARQQELPMSLAWYRRKRLTGDGPEFVRVGRRVFYERGTLRRFVASKKQSRASDNWA
jgi:hypothetical protein